MCTISLSPRVQTADEFTDSGHLNLYWRGDVPVGSLVERLRMNVRDCGEISQRSKALLNNQDILNQYQVSFINEDILFLIKILIYHFDFEENLIKTPKIVS